MYCKSRDLKFFMIIVLVFVLFLIYTLLNPVEGQKVQKTTEVSVSVPEEALVQETSEGTIYSSENINETCNVDDQYLCSEYTYSDEIMDEIPQSETTIYR